MERTIRFSPKHPTVTYRKTTSIRYVGTSFRRVGRVLGLALLALGLFFAMFMGATIIQSIFFSFEGSVSLAAPVYAHGGDSSQMHACLNTASGHLRVIAPSEACRDSEKALHWYIACAPSRERTPVVSPRPAPIYLV
jgi:hypothetical protein